MKNARRRRRSAHQGNVLTMLAQARPESLNANATDRAAWPDAARLIEAADRTQPDSTCYQIHGAPDRRRRGSLHWLWHSPQLPPKLLGALASAAVTVVVIILAVVLGTVVFPSSHRPGPGPTPASSPGAPVFHQLALSPQWKGRLSYAVVNGVVRLDGSARFVNGKGTSDGIVTLPPGARPAGELILAAIVSGRAGEIEIGADGRLLVVDPGGGQVRSLSVDGVAFAIGSR